MTCRTVTYCVFQRQIVDWCSLNGTQHTLSLPLAFAGLWIAVAVGEETGVGLTEGCGLSFPAHASLRLRQLITKAKPATAAAAAKGTPITRAHCHLESFVFHPASSNSGLGTRKCVKGRDTLMLLYLDIYASGDQVVHVRQQWPAPLAALRMRICYAHWIRVRAQVISHDDHCSTKSIVREEDSVSWLATSHLRQ